MSPSPPLGRITKVTLPQGTLRRHNYRERALPCLRIDFEDRCAYSLQHIKRIGEAALEVDHFNPTKKTKPIQDYLNLFPSTRHCNNRKSTFWPKTREEVKSGKRLLNPRREIDYDEQIVECLDSGDLIGLTAAAKFHIIKLDLNADHFCRERIARTRQIKLMSAGPITLIERQTSFAEVAKLIAQSREATEHLMSPIKPATSGQIGQALADGLILGRPPR